MVKIVDNNTALERRLKKAESNRSSSKIKIMCHNQGQWSYGVQPTGLPDETLEKDKMMWRNFIAKHNCDLLILQEYRRRLTQSDSEIDLQAYDEIFVNSYPHFESTGSGQGLALMSKYELSDRTLMPLYNEASGTNRALFSYRVNIGGKSILLVTTHLSTAIADYDNERQEQRNQLLDHVKDEEYFILCGDFNPRQLSEYDDFRNEGYNLANHGWWGDFKTAHYPSFSYSKDNIITSPNIKIDNFFVEDHVTSDHRALLSELTIY